MTDQGECVCVGGVLFNKKTLISGSSRGHRRWQAGVSGGMTGVNLTRIQTPKLLNLLKCHFNGPRGRRHCQKTAASADVCVWGGNCWRMWSDKADKRSFCPSVHIYSKKKNVETEVNMTHTSEWLVYQGFFFFSLTPSVLIHKLKIQSDSKHAF